MGVGVTTAEPITAMRAKLKVEEAEVVDSSYRDDKGQEQKQFACVLKVLSGAADRDGAVFNEWFKFPATGKIGKKTKTGQVLSAALGEDANAETLEELAKKLVGRTFVAQIGTSRNGEYSRVVHDTISPAPPEEAAAGDGGWDEGDPEADSEHLTR